ncbi:MAG: orotidine-5'-phosphate decarboxylase [Steroidobacteraceae bacterium]
MIDKGSFIERIARASARNNSLLCVGLDPEPAKFPESLRLARRGVIEFNRYIIDATAQYVCCYKPQFAHYAAVGAEDQLAETIKYIHDHHPDIPVILDSKRGDIGSTAEKYAQEAFERYGADAVTVNPYLGLDSLEPFLKWKGRGVIVLCRTSNPGARDFQDLEVGGEKLYRIVAQRIARDANAAGNCLLVIGATYPGELAEIRALVGDMPFLVPGIGAQGGDLKAAVQAGRTPDGAGLIISSSRGIIYAGTGEEFAPAAGVAARTLRDEINLYR